MEPPAISRARAIRWCGNLAGWFPQLRPGPAALAAAEDVARSLGSNDGEVPAERIRAEVERLDAAERRGLVAAFASEHADQWAAVCADAGDVAALEDALVAGSVRASIQERRLPYASRLSDLEVGRAPAADPRAVLAVTLPAEAVWSIVDAQAAERAASEAAGLGAVMEMAEERASEEHALRVRALAAVLRRQLPLGEFPRASALLDEAYGRALDEDGFADLVAKGLLTIYVAERGSSVTSLN
jgi:hypothetical protein